MPQFNELLEAATRWKDKPQERDAELRKLVHDDKFPVVMSLLVEFQGDMGRSVSNYNRSADERTMDAGGLATVNKMIDFIEGLMQPTPADPPAPEPESASARPL